MLVLQRQSQCRLSFLPKLIVSVYPTASAVNTSLCLLFLMTHSETKHQTEFHASCLPLSAVCKSCLMFYV